MAGYRDLVVWQKSMELVADVYRATESFPKYELYGLVNQLRRAAVSIPSNVAEGQARNSKKEFHQFVGHARGSLAEVETQIELACRLGYLSRGVASKLLDEAGHIGRMLTGLRTWTARETNQRLATSD